MPCPGFDALVAGEGGAPLVLVLLLHGVAESMHCGEYDASANRAKAGIE